MSVPLSQPRNAFAQATWKAAIEKHVIGGSTDRSDSPDDSSDDDGGIAELLRDVRIHGGPVDGRLGEPREPAPLCAGHYADLTPCRNPAKANGRCGIASHAAARQPRPAPLKQTSSKPDVSSTQSALNRPAAGTKKALCIGINDYSFHQKLETCVADAQAIAAAMKKSGFIVTVGKDLTLKPLREMVKRFMSSLEHNDTAFIFLSGHGVTHDGYNMFLPADHDESDFGEWRDTLRLTNSVTKPLEDAKTRMSVVLLDACRSSTRTGRKAAVGTASSTFTPLRSDEIPHGMVVGYATAHDKVAYDGPTGGHSLYVQALLEHLTVPNDIRFVLTDVRRYVVENSPNKQSPWDTISLITNNVSLVYG